MKQQKEHSSSHFIIPIKYYLITFLSLIILTIITIYTAKYVDLGKSGNVILALVIADIKASLVILFFMGLRWGSTFNRVFFLSSILFLMIFLVFTLIDYASRNDLEPSRNTAYEVKTPVKKKMIKTEKH